MLQFYGNIIKSVFKNCFYEEKKKKARERGTTAKQTKQNPRGIFICQAMCTRTRTKTINLKLHSYILNSLKLFISILKNIRAQLLW